MADEKKPIQATGGDNIRTTEQLIFLLVGLALVGAVVTTLFNYIEDLGLGEPSVLWNNILNYFFLHVWPIWKLIAVIVSVSALVGAIYNSWKLRAINVEEKKIFDPPLT
jgi:hypothetical protein